MGKMLFADWKEWATRRPEWAGGDMGADFEKFVERKWRDALNVAAAEPQGWEVSGSKPDKGSTEKPAQGRLLGERPTAAVRRTSRASGAANVVTTGTTQGGRGADFNSIQSAWVIT
jgi:hypothetical protein